MLHEGGASQAAKPCDLPHLDNGEQCIESIEVGPTGLDGDPDDRQRGHGGHHTGQMSSTT